MFLKILIFLLVPVICVIILQQKVFAEVVISEVMPDPAAASDASEWVELYNAGSSPVSLSGWKLDGKPISDISITSNNFVVFTKNLAAFKTEFGDLTGVYELAIGLTNSGDSISLIDPNGKTDTFAYTSSTPNRSWERTGPLCNEIILHPTSHTVLAANKASKSECFPVTQSPATPEVDPQATIQFSLDNQTWADTIQSLGPTNLSFKADLNDDPNKYQLTWSLADGTAITSPISLNNYLNQPIKLHLTKADQEWDFVSQPINIVSQINITEVLLNSSADTWLELFNPNNFLVNGTFQLNQQNININVAAQDFLLINLNDQQCTANCDVVLKSGEVTLQNLHFETMPADQSWSLGDSAGWHDDWQITPEAPNAPKPPIIYDNSVQISEVYPSPDSSKGEQEWFELYNFSDVQIDLANWYVTDTSKSYLLNGKIAAKGYLIFMKPGISLNNGGDQISLFNPNQELVDSFSYVNTATGISQIKQFQTDKYSTEIVSTTKPTPDGLNDLVQKQSSSSISSSKTVVIKTSGNSSSMSQILGASEIEQVTNPYQLPNLLADHLPSNSYVAQTEDITTEILPWAIILIVCGGYLGQQLWLNYQSILNLIKTELTKVQKFHLDLIPD